MSTAEKQHMFNLYWNSTRDAKLPFSYF